MEVLKLIRIKDWLKNIIIFFPLIFSGYLFDLSNYSKLVIGFFTFSFISSIIYILNDILDIERSTPGNDQLLLEGIETLE